jgi:hypothetical protein
MNQNAVHSHGVSDPSHTHQYSTLNSALQDGFDSTVVSPPELVFTTGTTAPAVTGISINTANVDHIHSFNTGAMSANSVHSHTFTTNATGSGASIDNRPPYYALAYIMKA